MILTKGELTAAAVAVLIACTALFMSSDEAVGASHPECATYAVRVPEDGGWTAGNRFHPPRLYCDAGHRMEPMRDGLIVCFCEEKEPLKADSE